MKNWKIKLNQLVVDYWCGIGSSSEVLEWVDEVSSTDGEVHPFLFELYNQSNSINTARLLKAISKDINKFELESWESEEYAKQSLHKTLGMFINRKITVQQLCSLVHQLDGLYNLQLAGVENPKQDQDKEWLLGDLYNCCDYCDITWNHQNSTHLISEAMRIYEKRG